MRNTCLYSFYEYILKNWIQTKEIMPNFDGLFGRNRFESSELKIQELSERKKYIWDNTRLILEQDSEKRRDMLQKLLQQPIQCDLCVACQKCEKRYWQALKELTLDDNKDTDDFGKSDFLLPEEIRELLKQKERPVDIYLDHYKRRVMHERNLLVMLKGFSSSTPILLNYAQNTNFYSGGGFYIRWNGVGIAVDPGYLFVQNLQDYGLSVLDIDVVIITHEHIDHTSDMRILDDLHYNASKYYSEKTIGWDAQQFLVSHIEKKHKITWYMDVVTCEEAVVLARKKSGFDTGYNEIFCINVAGEETSLLENKFEGYANVVTGNTIEIDDEITMHIFQTAHEQYEVNDVKEYFLHTYGCVFECGKNVENKRFIGYTSDTSIQDSVYSKMESLLSQCHIIVANISGIYENDVLFKKFKARHLGYYGCYKIVYDLIMEKNNNLKYLLLSEFSNQVSDIRFGVSKYLQEEVNDLVTRKGRTPVRVLPTEIALTLNLDTFQTKCDVCGEYSDKIHVLRPYGENNKLQYICSECMY